MFKKILIANRGEIACRIIRTAKKMGISTIAIYSTVDQQSQHVKQADEAYSVGEAAAKSSYLNIDAIINVAQQSGATAIHPGYGFLSENPEFAEACENAGIIFIGPSVSAMRAMASKQLAKQLLEKTQVPLTPGYHGKEQSDEQLLNAAKRIGFPVLIKAANGGGGKGMRAVQNEQEFLSALAGARRESMASFADDTMIIEKLVRDPRHVEVQIMADQHGAVVHLFERDCSIQRRHQKIIEEAPAPALSSTLRQALTTAACEVAHAIQYSGAGTVEFLVDKDEQFYFMEMNTRLQVEHPVTEMITGLDLVEWQIRIANREPLPCQQNQIQQRGHAIECRIYAEDPHQDFMPSTGQLTYLHEPDGEGVRIDTGVTCGSVITQYYDPMIAKLIVWGENRDESLQRLQQALKHFYVGGVKTNIPFLQAICHHPVFVRAELSTDFLGREQLTMPTTDADTALLMAAAYDYLALFQQEADPIFQQSIGWQMHLSTAWPCYYLIDNKKIELFVTSIDDKTLLIRQDDKTTHLRVDYKPNHIAINQGECIQQAQVANQPDAITFFFEQGQITVQRFQWESSHDHAVEENQLTAPMPATVVAILKKQGDKIKKGEQLIVLEAMKMEHTIHAPKDGVLRELFYDIGAQVKEGAELLSLE